MSKPRLTFYDHDALLSRLEMNSRPIMFLVGSGLTASHGGRPGVADVDGVVELARTELQRSSRIRNAMEHVLRNTVGDDRYQIVIGYLKASMNGADAANAVIRQAVLQACKRSDVDIRDMDSLEALESDVSNWYLSPAVRALGWLIARHPDRFSRTVITTNFDPLIEVAIRAAGGHSLLIDMASEGQVPTGDATVASVVHLHGPWRSGTLHTPTTIGRSRPELSASLACLFEQCTLVVMGYGGWNDVVMDALEKLTQDYRAQADLLWCFYESNEVEIQTRYPGVISLMSRMGERMAVYRGIDCHVALPALRKHQDREGSLLGRRYLCDQLTRKALDEGETIHIVGEPHMGLSQVLSWFVGEVGEPVALVDAQKLAYPTPASLLREIADQVGRRESVEAQLQRETAMPTEDDAAQALSLLYGIWVLVDNMDALAVPGHGFGRDVFFTRLAAAIERKDLRWMSVGREQLHNLFEPSLTNSPFFNIVKPIDLGALVPQEVELALVYRFGERAKGIMDRTGTLPPLVERVCRADEDELDLVLSSLSAWAQELFQQWWQRPAPEQDLLMRLASDYRGTLEPGEKTCAERMHIRGLLIKTSAGSYSLNGRVWAEYVKEQE